MDYFLPRTDFKITPIPLRRLIFLACLILASASAFAEKKIIIVSPASSNYSQSLVQNILTNLEATDIKADVFNIDQQVNISTNYNLIVSIGKETTSLSDIKDLSIPKLRVVSKIDSNKKTNRINETYLSMTQPVCKQFTLIRSLNSDWKTVSILLGKPNTPETKKLETCAAQYNLTLKTILISQYVNIIDALNSSLSNSDVLLALPDPSIYNAKTVKSILLTTYRHRIPVIGFSEGFVHAGALTAIHSSTEQLGKQITELIIKHYENEKTNKHHLYPKYFDIAINKDVAKSLGITIPDRKVLIEKLKNHNHE